LNLDKAIYEFINLSVPLIKKYDCDLDDPVPCNFTAKDVLEYVEDQEEEEESEEENPFAKAFKNIDLN